MSGRQKKHDGSTNDDQLEQEQGGGGGGRRQVRQRTSKDAAYALRLASGVDDIVGAGSADVSGGGRKEKQGGGAANSAAAAAAAAAAGGGGGGGGGAAGGVGGGASRKRRWQQQSSSSSEAGNADNDRQQHVDTNSNAAAGAAKSTVAKSGRKGGRRKANANANTAAFAASASAASSAPTPPPAAGQKKKRRGGPGPGWACRACTLHNPSRKRKCEACGTAKPSPAAAAAVAAAAAAAAAAGANNDNDNNGSKQSSSSASSASASAYGEEKKDDDSSRSAKAGNTASLNGTAAASAVAAAAAAAAATAAAAAAAATAAAKARNMASLNGTTIEEREEHGAAKKEVESSTIDDKSNNNASISKDQVTKGSKSRAKQSSSTTSSTTNSKSSTRSRSRASSSSSAQFGGSSVSEWLRRRKGKRGRSSPTTSAASSASGRSRSPSPVPPSSSAKSAKNTSSNTRTNSKPSASASASTSLGGTGSSDGGTCGLDDINPKDIKTVTVRVCNNGGNELSDSGTLSARLLVGWPRFCSTKKEEGCSDNNDGGDSGDGNDVAYYDDDYNIDIRGGDINPKDIKTVTVRVCNNGGNELSDSGTLSARLLVGWPRFCSTKKEEGCSKNNDDDDGCNTNIGHGLDNNQEGDDDEKDDFEGMFADTSFRVARPEIHAMAVGERKAARKVGRSKLSQSPGYVQSNVQFPAGTSTMGAAKDVNDMPRDVPTPADTDMRAEENEKTVSVVDEKQYMYHAVDDLGRDVSKISDSGKHAVEYEKDDETTDERQSPILPDVAVSAEPNESQIPADNTSLDMPGRAGPEIASIVGGPSSTSSSCPSPISRVVDQESNGDCQIAVEAASRLDQDEVVGDRSSRCFMMNQSQMGEPDAEAREASRPATPASSKTTTDDVVDGESKTKENEEPESEKSLALVKKNSLDSSACACNQPIPKPESMATEDDVAVPEETVQDSLSHQSGDYQSQSSVLRESHGTLNTTTPCGPVDAAPLSANGHQSEANCTEDVVDVASQLQASEDSSRDIDRPEDAQRVELAEPTVSSNDGDASANYRNDNPIDDIGRAPASVKTFSPQLESSPLMTKDDAGQPSHEESRSQKDPLAPNESSPSQFSQQSHASLGAFELLTQAIPTFEYGYALTQQQGGCHDPVQPLHQSPNEDGESSNVNINGLTGPLPACSSVGKDAKEGSFALESSRTVDDTTAREHLLDIKETPAAASVPRESSAAVADSDAAKADYESGYVGLQSSETVVESTGTQKHALACAGAYSAMPLFAAAGKEGGIAVSDEAMSRANEMFGEPTSVQEQATSSAPMMFSTAGGASISVSEDAMAKANEMFGGNSSTQDQAHAAASAPPMFSTAGQGKAIMVSEDAMAKASEMFGGSSQDQAHAASSTFSAAGKGASISVSATAMAKANDVLGEPVHNQAHAPPSVAAAMFSTAGQGKAIVISEDAMAKANAIFGGSTQDRAQAPSSAPPMFSTAGKGASISVSGEAMAKANEMFGNNSRQDQAQAAASAPPMFSTAGQGKAIMVSEDAMAKASEMFSGPKQAQAQGASSASAAIFSTAGKCASISVSEDVMAKANEMFGNNSRQDQAQVAATAPPMFSTADQGRAISVSEDAMAKASEIFGGSTHDQAQAPPSASAVMFSTVGKGASISVSGEAMAKANEMFGNNSRQDQAQAASASAPPMAPMFSTAGQGKAIMVSEDAMAKASEIFDGSKQDQAQAPPSASMFSTAGKCASISVSGEAMAKASEMFGEPVQNLAQGVAPPPPAAMFSTAGQGKSIAISEDAVARASEMFGGPAKDQAHADSSAPAAMFSTAGKGASITVSEDAKEKANEMFDGPAKDQAQGVAPPPAAMFSTAGGGKAIAISEDAVAKANEIFSGPLQDQAQGASSSAPPMFSTAGKGRSIAISEDAMSKANQMFAQKDLSTAGSTKNVSVSIREEPFDESNTTKEDGYACRPRGLHFAETPAHSVRGGSRNRLSFGGATANENFAQHLHPAETPLPESSKHAPRHLSTKKVLFREDNGPSASRLSGNAHEPTNSFVEADGLEQKDLDESFKSSHALTNITSAYTPKHTPYAVRKPAAVTRSTTVRNPYARKSSTSIDTDAHSSAVTPVPFVFKHVEGKFGGTTFSPKTLAKAAQLLEQPSRPPPDSTRSAIPVASRLTKATNTKPRSLRMEESKTNRGEFHFSVDGSRLSLRQFDASYGPMETDFQRALERGVQPVILKLNSTNASRLRFDEQTGLPCGLFGASNTPGCKMVGGVQDLRRELISQGCNESLLVDKWIVNHFGWINWKLASTERRYPDLLAGKYLNYQHVISQLMQRYEKEIRAAKRPALRIVLNRDASSGRLMILCVSQVHRFRVKAVSSGDDSNGEQPSPKRSQREEIRLELTDGWYSVPAVLDQHLLNFVQQGKIKIGSKLLVAGAELVGSEDGIDPLDASYVPSRSSCPVALKLTANATRRAKWDAKLGFVKPTRTIQSHDGLLLVRSLADVIPGGGSVPLMDLIICRRFPRLYLEKGNGSSSTILTEAQEGKRRREFEERRHREMEKISDAAEKECTKVVDEQAPEQWTKMVTSSAMCDYYEGLSREEKAIVDRWEERRCSMISDMTRRVIDAKMQNDISLTRSSIPFLRLTVKSIQNERPPSHDAYDDEEDDSYDIPSQPSATLTVWRMSEDQCNVLKEGSVVRIKDLPVKDDLRDEMLQFSANDKTRMQLLLSQPSSRQLQFSGYTKRAFAPMVRAHVLSRKAASSRKSAGVHIDFAGVVVRSEQEQQGMSYSLSAYFTDESGLLLRLQRDIDADDDSAFYSWGKAFQEGQILAFRDALILPFDNNANCAVVSWTQPTVQEKIGNSQRIRTLQKWTESNDAQRTYATAIASFDTGLPLYSRLRESTEVAIGNVLAIRSEPSDYDFEAHYSSASRDHLEVDIDCGGGSYLITATCSRAVLSQTIEMHLDPTSHCGSALDLKDLLRQRSGTALAPSDVTALNTLFIESGILFQVMLRRHVRGLGDPSDMPEVLQMTPANIKALATLYLDALKA